MGDRELFDSLKEKLSEKPSAAFDGEFWAKFGGEFHRPVARPWSWSESVRWLAPLAMAAVLVLVVANIVWRSPSRGYMASRASADRPVIEYSALLEDFDLLLGEEGEDVAALSEEEWTILLTERNG